jgi:transcriptional regulator with XRE-family HTH domain
MATIGERIKTLRLARGMTQRELGKRVGVSAPAITQLESGTSKVPKGTVLDGLCRELRTNSAWLLEGLGESSASVSLDGDRHELVLIYDSLPDQGRDLLLAQARALHESFIKVPSALNPFQGAKKATQKS